LASSPKNEASVFSSTISSALADSTGSIFGGVEADGCG
jgi:hypothetical protein